jgi:plasmid stabilization system protein ParE
MQYNTQYLEELAQVPNIGTIIEQIDHAATIATEEMRRYGLTLPTVIPGTAERPQRVPLQHEVDTYLRFLVADAYIGFSEAKQEAQEHGAIAVMAAGHGAIPDTDIEGFPEAFDPMFDVSVTGLSGAPPGYLTVRISRRLTG